MEAIIEFEQHLLQSLENTFLGISYIQYLMALLFIFGGFLMRRVTKASLKRLGAAAKKSEAVYDDILVDILKKPLPAGMLILGIYLGIHALPVPTEPVDIRHFIHALFKSLTIGFFIWTGIRLVDRSSQVWLAIARRTEMEFDEQLIPLVVRSLKVFLGLVGGILVLQNLGYSVGSLLAGFGLGGAAVALAAKDSLSNLFGSVVIFMDRPFRVGDWVEMDGWEGTIEEIGLRTTRVRTFANSLMTVPNMKFTTGVINNWQRMKKRRITFRLGASYDTTPEQMEALVGRIRKIIAEDEDMNQDYYLVNFDQFGPSSLDIFIYCFTKTTVWKDFLEVRQKFCLKILRACQELGVEIAFPTQTVHLGGPVQVEGQPASAGN